MTTKRVQQTLSAVLSGKLLACVLCACLLSLSLPRGNSVWAAAPPPLKSESQIKSEASRYDTAMREIGRVAEMKLAVPEESKAALTVLDKQVPNLSYSRSKLVSLGLSDSSFVSAVKARAADKESAAAFARELAKDNKAILQVGGAQSLADRMRGSVGEDVTKLRRVAELLKKAGDEIKSKARAEHASKPQVVLARFDSTLRAPAGVGLASPAPAAADLDAGAVTVLVIAVAVIACPPLGLALFDLASVAAGAAVVAAAAVLLAQAVALTEALLLKVGTAKGRDQIVTCGDQADAKLRRCDTEADTQMYPLNYAASAYCHALWIGDMAYCLSKD